MHYVCACAYHMVKEGVPSEERGGRWMDGVRYQYMIDILHTELLRCCGLASRVGPPRASEVASRAAQGRDPVAFVRVEV